MGTNCVVYGFISSLKRFPYDGTDNNEPHGGCASAYREGLSVAGRPFADPCSVRSDGCCRRPWWPPLRYRRPVCLLPSAALRPTSGIVSLNKASGGDRSLLIFEELSSLQLFT